MHTGDSVIGETFQVEIVADSSGGPAFVAIDKILIGVGNEQRSLHMM